MRYKNITTALLLFFAFFFTNCSDNDDFYQNEDQELLAETPDEILKRIQKSFRLSFEKTNVKLMQYTRQINLFAEYNYNSFDHYVNNEVWRYSYNIFEDTELLIDFNNSNLNSISQSVGVAQVLRAYSFINLVDIFGDVPYSEVFTVGIGGNPAADDSSSVYQEQLNQLDLALEALNQDDSEIPADQFYGSFNKNNWIALANTLKLKIYTNLRLLDSDTSREQINLLLNTNFIDNFQEDFVFDYSLNSDIENHLYLDNIIDANFFMSNNLYDYMNVGDSNIPFVETGTVDPRARYYFYRQVDYPPSTIYLPCNGNSEYDYCYVGNLYWGRDHQDYEGLSPDHAKRTYFGVYPLGGEFDNNAFIRLRDNDNGLNGNGILPFFLSSYTNFLLAENALTIGITGSDNIYLEAGIRQSMQKVKTFAEGLITTNPEDSAIDYTMIQADVDTYVLNILEEYSAASNNDKLEIIEREYFIAAFGNGLETYNGYRRTGKPKLHKPFFDGEEFHRTIQYPSEALLNNTNLELLPVTQQVFWDNNPAGFID